MSKSQKKDRYHLIEESMGGAQQNFNQTARPYPADVTLHQLVEQCVATHAGKVAVIFGKRRLTFAALNRRANQLAHLLRSAGAGPDTPVGVFMQRSPELVIALLGILKAGSAYVPLDPEYPPERLAYMLRDSAAPLVLTHGSCRGQWSAVARSAGSLPDVVDMDADRERLEALPESNPENAVRPEHLAYVIYTSGSTGRPRGAMNTHRGICNRLLWMQETYHLTEKDVVLQKTPYSFDVSVWEFFWPLISGATLAVAPPGIHRDSAALAQLIQSQRVSVLHFVPSMLQQFLADPAAGQCTTLRDVICSGEALTPALQARFFAVFPHTHLHNLYGPTECAVDVTYWQCRRDSHEAVVPIGRPVANTQIYILDENRRPVPIGETGEIYIGGVQVGRGYWNRPQLTAERFVPSPFSNDPGGGERLYRSGDLGRWRPDGVIEFLGRRDFQVKIRGHRIELGEIEAALEAHPAIGRAVVTARRDEREENQLIAYYTAAGEHLPTGPALREFLQQKLPAYMIPARFVTLAALPLLPNGKIDRAALPAPDRQRPALTQPYAPPQTTLEAYLAELWQNVLGVDRIGRDDRFFELGGSSLQAGEVIATLQKALGASIFVVTLFDAPTIAAYAAFLEKHYPDGVRRILEKRSASSAGRAPVPSGSGAGRLTAAMVAAFRDGIPALSRDFREPAAEPNAPALFVLAPPRSGTTLLRVMLAGHPRIFAAAELQLLNFQTLAERRSAFSGKYRLWLEGTVRAVMALQQCDAARAWEMMEQFEQAGLSTRQFYAVLQGWLGERMLAEKTPQYALHPDYLAKAERDFVQPRYIHLVRHPYAMVTSFVQHHMDQVLFTAPHDFSPRELGELVWLVSHRNICDFLQTVPPERQFLLRFEDLVRDPEKHIRALCAQLDLPFHPGLLTPYQHLDRKMVDGLHAHSRPMGDEQFLAHREINPALADRWKGVRRDDFLSEMTRELAVQLGYESLQEKREAGGKKRAAGSGKRAAGGEERAAGSEKREAGSSLAIVDDHARPTQQAARPTDIAIIGMAGRFPGADDVEALWQNLLDGVESLRRYSAADLRAAGIDPAVLDDPNYVPVGGCLNDPAGFDAAFFGYTPREAEQMDPQQRVFLECAYLALQNAGYAPSRYRGRIGVFGGVGRNAYLIDNIVTDAARKAASGEYSLILGNDKDYAVTRVAYKLDLRGPAFNVQTACSTSAVAVHLACQSLQSGDSDIALAGGCRIMNPPQGGYTFVEGGPHSPDGHLRAFDAAANGMVRTSGAAFVVLKRLEEALRDGDTVYAVILGSAVNNDGADKIGFTAPAVRGQSECVTLALERAGISPDTIGYVEAHGTGTVLGDPIEVAGLTRAFRRFTDRKNFCALGSIKTNIGHLDAAAGVAGIIKAALALYHGQIPPTLHFRTPNPEIDFANSPFYVNGELRAWPRPPGHPRRAAVNSLGLGGTNAHIVLEEAPPRRPASPGRDWHLLLLSAKTTAALESAAAGLADYLQQHPEISLADAAYTLQTGREAFARRQVVVCPDAATAGELLRTNPPGQVFRGTCPGPAAPDALVFMFAGGGAQYLHMGRGLYESEPLFREVVDQCAQMARPLLGLDLREQIYPRSGDEHAWAAALEQPSVALPALFTIQFATARLWMSWGIEPAAMIGHSMGEYTAACLAGVFSLEDALKMVHRRGVLFESLPEGSMLSVPLSEGELRSLMTPELSIAAVNKPDLCVASGPTPAIEALARRLAERGIEATRVRIHVAAHSQMVEPILEPFGEFLQQIEFHPPKIPLISNLSGRWAGSEVAAPQYWVQHLRGTVHFAEGLTTLLQPSGRIFLEVGPGQVLATLARQHPRRSEARAILTSLRHPRENTPDLPFLLTTAGRLWLAGVEIDWNQFYRGQRRFRVPLPGYPFERRRFWIDPAAPPRPAAATSTTQTEGSPPVTAPPVAAAPDRPTRIATALQHILQELSGIPAEQLDPRATFLELGFDSLFLTQANTAFQKKFGVKISFRQLFEEAPTIAALAEFIDSQLPADAFPAAASPPPAAAAPPGEVAAASLPPSSPAADAGTIERIVQQQLAAMQQLVAQQLAALQGAATPPVEGGASAAPDRERRSDAPQSAAGRAETPEGGGGQKVFGPWRPLEKTRMRTLTAEQEAHLAQFIRRHVQKTAGSKALAAAQRPVYADPQAVNGFQRLWKEIIYPLAAAHSRGARFVDVDGNEYVDLIMGFGVHLFGHSPDFVREALQQQLQAGWHLGVLSPLAKAVAEMICELTGFERVNIVNTGTEAVLAAVRAARTVTGRDKIAVFEGDYHGLVDEFLVRGVNGRSLPVAPGIPRFLVENTLVLEYNETCLDLIRENAADLAGVLIEPVTARDPGFQPAEIIRQVRAVTRELGIALIFDELITGFRLHPRGAQGWYGVEADMCSYGKAISGGLPIGVVAGRSEYIDAFDGGRWNYGDDSFPEKGVTYFIGTFARNPLSLAAAHAALREIKAQSPQMQIALNRKTARFARQANALLARKKAPLRLVHGGSIIKFVFTEENSLNQLFFLMMRDRGVLLRERACYLSTAHTDEDLALVLRALEQTVEEMQAHGLLAVLPGRAGAAALRQWPLTAPQTEIWLAAALGDAASCAFIVSTAVELSGPLDCEALEAALGEVVRRHEALRTTFDEAGTSQRIAAQRAVTLPLHDLSALPENEQQTRWTALQQGESRTPFDLARGPLFRAFLVRFAPQRHVLVFSAHHLVCDGWSLGVLMDELGQLYQAFSQGKMAALPDPLPFREYARIIAERREGEAGRATAEYWLAQYRNPLPALQLPLDHPRPAQRSFRSGQVFARLDAAAFAALKQTATRQGATPFAALLAGIALLLHRLSGQEEFALGLAAAGQSTVENPALVGHCVNLLPLRLHLDAQQRFGDFLMQVKRELLDAFDHREFTFGDLLQRLKLPRSESGVLRSDPTGRGVPLLSAILTYESALTEPNFGELAARSRLNPKSYCNFDLEWYLTETPEGLSIRLDYNADIFTAETAQRWVGYLQHILQWMTRSASVPDGGWSRPLAAVPVIPEAELRRLLVEWNQTDLPLPDEACIHTLVEAQVRRTPEAVALVAGGQELTYRELNRRANRLARYLRQQGVTAESVVGVCLNRTAEMIVALLAVLKSGAAYLPLDPRYPTARIGFMLRDSAAALLLTHGAVAEQLNTTDAPLPPLVALDREQEQIAAQSARNLSAKSGPENLAYLIYTSGSTGRPKGVMVEHRNAVALLHWAKRVFEPDDLAGMLAATSICFDLSVFEIFLPLSAGGTVILAEDALHLLSLPDRERVRQINTVPSAAAELLRQGGIPSGVRTVSLAGEPLKSDLVDALYEAGVQRVFDLYGPSETTTYSTVALRRPGGAETIGRPIANTRAYVLDAHGQPVPPGVPGELYLGGAGVARGYLNHPEQTAQRFIPPPELPFGETLPSRLYRTGDRVRWLPDLPGNLQFLGRIDQQIKLRGFRIEPGEIEAVLRGHPAVAAAVVMLREDAPGDNLPGLVAYLLAADAPDSASPREKLPEARELRAFAARQLPEAMIPAAFVWLEALPRTPNGKLDRQALPAPSVVSAPVEEFRPPQGPLEAAVAALWQEFLHLPKVGRHDNFFELGGHSLLAVQIAARLRDRFQVALPLRTLLFDAPTVAEVAAQIETAQTAAPLTAVENNGSTGENREEFEL